MKKMKLGKLDKSLDVKYSRTSCHSLTSVGAQANVNVNPAIQKPEFLKALSSLLRICLIFLMKDSSQA